MEVYIVSTGEDFEGGTILGGFSTRGAAHSYCLDYMIEADAEAGWEATSMNHWHDNSCTWLDITRLEINE